MIIEDFGFRVANAWAGLRPNTRQLVESALQSTIGTNSAQLRATTSSAPYDSRAERELSGLLTALDERASERGVKSSLSVDQRRELKRVTDTCALVLQSHAQSAESFAQLIERALGVHDYERVDALADTLLLRLAPSEICELARHHNRVVRAIAQESLIHTPTYTLIEMLNDQVDADAARRAIERQASDYGSDEAKWVISTLLDHLDADEV